MWYVKKYIIKKQEKLGLCGSSKHDSMRWADWKGCLLPGDISIVKNP